MTADCREPRPLLGAYVLGALEPEEAALVREHVAHCPACAAEHTRLAPLPGLLTLAEGAISVHAEPLPPALEEHVLDAVAAETPSGARPVRGLPRPSRRGRLGGSLRRPFAVALGGIGVAAAVALAVLVLIPGPSGSSPTYDHEVVLRAVPGVPRATAYAELADVPGGTTLHLQVRGLPGNPAAVYEVRCEAPDWSASAGTFRTDAHGRASLVLGTAARAGEYDHIRIVRRATGGDQLVLSGALT